MLKQLDASAIVDFELGMAMVNSTDPGRLQALSLKAEAFREGLEILTKYVN